MHTHTHQNKPNKQRIRNQFCVGQLLLCMVHTIGEDCFSFSQVLNVNSALVRGMTSPSQFQDFVYLNQCRSQALPSFLYRPPPPLPSSRIMEKQRMKFLPTMIFQVTTCSLCCTSNRVLIFQVWSTHSLTLLFFSNQRHSFLFFFCLSVFKLPGVFDN